MNSETSIVAEKFRLQEWAAQIRECQNRPTGMSVADWCANNGITKANYYYRLRRVWETCLETIHKEMPAQQTIIGALGSWAGVIMGIAAIIIVIKAYVQPLRVRIKAEIFNETNQ